jgi:hypothetical protein
MTDSSTPMDSTVTEAVERLAVWLFDRYSAVSDWHGCSEHLRAEWRSDAAAILEVIRASKGEVEDVMRNRAGRATDGAGMPEDDGR